MCGSFIRNYLGQYSQRIIFIPGDENEMNIDVIIDKDDVENRLYLHSIFIDGLSCMYEEGADEVYDYYSSDYHYCFSNEKL